MRPFIRVQCHKSVRDAVREEIRWLASILPDLSILNHRIEVRIFHASFVKHEDGDDCFGLFYAATKYTPCRILIAGGIPVAEAGDTMCHEWAHYEQWRDGRKLNERGVKARAKKIYGIAKEMM